MSKVPGLPDVKPDTAVEVTEPMRIITVEIKDGGEGIITVEFGEGEVITCSLSDDFVLADAAFALAYDIGGYLSANQLVWAEPERVAAELAERAARRAAAAGV